jgi:hypothetical protein
VSLRYGKSTGFLETIGDGGTVSLDTFTCSHCQFIVSFKPFCDPADAGGHCKLCDGLICKNCVKRRVCIPIEARITHMEGGWIDRAKLEEWERTPVIAIGT